MKRLFVAISLITFNATAQYQNVIDADYPWYSDIIKYKLPDANSTGGISSLIEVVPKTDSIDFTERLVFLDEILVRLEFGNALNEMRARYNKSTLKYNDTISQNLKYSYENEIAADYASTYVLFESVEYQNIVMHFENKERAYCNYFIDLATMTDTDFFEMTAASATEYGFYFDDTNFDGFYTFIVVIK
jgi:hypothetical protein